MPGLLAVVADGPGSVVVRSESQELEESGPVRISVLALLTSGVGPVVATVLVRALARHPGLEPLPFLSGQPRDAHLDDLGSGRESVG